MAYTHTFEITYTNDHDHAWEGEVSFDHGQEVTMKFANEPEFTAEQIRKINEVFRAVANLCTDCGVPDTVEIKVKTP